MSFHYCAPQILNWPWHLNGEKKPLIFFTIPGKDNYNLIPPSQSKYYSCPAMCFELDGNYGSFLFFLIWLQLSQNPALLLEWFETANVPPILCKWKNGIWANVKWWKKNLSYLLLATISAGIVISLRESLHLNNFITKGAISYTLN